MELTSSDPGKTSRRWARGLLIVVLLLAGVSLIVGGALAMGLPQADPGVAPPQPPDSTATSTPRPQTHEPVTVLSDRVVVADDAKGAPTRVSIPRLGVLVEVIPISASDGRLRPPDDPQLLGWWRHGAEAGAVTGSAVVTGHTVHTGGGALDALGTLRLEDAVFVTTPRGRIEYAVREITDLTKDEFAVRARQVLSQEVPGRLVLITCTDWDGHDYLSNTVVVADPVPAAS